MNTKLSHIEEAHEAAGWLEIKSIHSTGVVFCRSPRLQKSRFQNLRRTNEGWTGKIHRNEIFFDGEDLYGDLLLSKEGSPLLPEEERLLVLWQNNGNIIVSTEDEKWQGQITSICTSPLVEINRPGSRTLLWELPENYIFF